MTHFLVITGASRGIGEQTAATFLRDGWQVLNLSRTDSKMSGITSINIDLTKPDAIHNAAKTLQEKVDGAGKICLIHNAALLKNNQVDTLDENDLREDLEINVIAPVILNKIFLPFMKPGSSIIYIGSTLSEIGVANRASYVIAKHAIAGLMRATCQDLAGKEISTCCICPGFTDTKMLHDAVPDDTLKQIIKENVTFGRLANPQEIADLIYFAATHPVINGAMLHANLGQVDS